MFLKPMQKPMARYLIVLSAILSVLVFSPRCPAVTIVSGPTFTPATNAPLAGLLQLTTDVDSRVSVLVSDGTNLWERDFYDFATTHSVPLLGFEAGRTNLIQVTVYDKYRTPCTASQLLTFVTGHLPTNFPPSVVLTCQPDQMEPGYTFFMIRNLNANLGYIVIMDNSGNVVWYSPLPNFNDLDVRPLDNGDVFIPGYQNQFSELNMLGQTVKTWTPPTAYHINPHEGFPTDHGTILYVSDVSRLVTNLPTSAVSNAPVKTENVDDNPVVEISATNAALLNAWSPLNMLDPTRISYLTYTEGSGSPYGVDTEHGNAVLEDTNDNSLVESLRNQNAVFKFSRTGQLKWILGPPADWSTNLQPYLLTPVGTPFDWNYGQHAPELTPQGTWLVYNDNNYQASPFDAIVPDSENYSSAIEFNINETNLEVSEVWNSSWQTNQDRLFTPFVGRVQWLPQTRNVLVTFGAVSYINGMHPSSYSTNATMVRLIEYTHDPVPQVVFDISFLNFSNTNSSDKGYFTYRAYQIPDLYPHPANPVTDLALSNATNTSCLQFSADPTRTYVVQASTDLANWTTIGPALEEGGVGDFEFYDLDASQYQARFYRVLTQ